METFTIGDQPVGPDEPTFIIAEAGSNHNGDKELAKGLIDAAANAGADAVKFQLFRADRMYPEDSGELSTGESSAYDTFKKLEIPYEWVSDLCAYATDRDLQFMASPFDRESADLLEEYVPAFKIASTLVSHHPFLNYLASKDKPLIISTGSHSLSDVEEMLAAIPDIDLALLQCVSAYPTPLDQANVGVVTQLQDAFDLPAGLSDHTLDPTTAPTVAASLGAVVIEKHLTLDKSLDGPDHSFSLEPEQFAALVDSVRDAEAALGTGRKKVLDIESETYENGRRCLHAAVDIEAGTTITEKHIQALRPGGNQRGIAPSETDRVLGSQASTNISIGEPIQETDIE
jgi:N-acetylneuraminate synthase